MSKKLPVQSLSRLFHVFSDPTRLKLLLTLKNQGETNVTNLCGKLKMPQPTVSHHLALLRAGGMVRNRRSGKQVHYSIDPSRFEKARQAALDVFD